MTVSQSAPPYAPRTVAIVGAGTMGLGIAEYFAHAGLQVALSSSTPERTRSARDQLLVRVQRHVEAGLLPAEALERAATVTATSDLGAALSQVELVVESVPEQHELKCRVLAAIAAQAPTSAVIATNTSTIPIDDLAPHVTHPERFLGLHWFNPPEWTPGVEVIPGAQTLPALVTHVRSWLLAIGKRPAVVKSVPAFVANRIQLALFREAAACVAEGLATPQEVDEVVRSTFGFRLPFFGPFQIADMAGLDVYEQMFRIMEQALGTSWEPPAALRAQREHGRLGAKQGAGFYEYTAEERAQLLTERDRRYAALSQLLAQLPPLVPRSQ